MKILHIAPIGHHAEGIGSVLQKLVPLQINKGEEVKIVSPFVNYTYHELPITTITNKKDFKTFVNSWSPDIVIFHSVFNLKYYIFYKVLVKMNIPFLIQLHGALSVENYNKNKLKKRLALFLWIRHFIYNARSIIYLNEAEYKNSIVPKFNSKFLIIPNGCDCQDNVKVYKRVEGRVNIVYIGRIAYVHKGLDVLIESLKKLEERKMSGYHFTFYGNEDDIDVSRLKADIANMQTVSYGGGVYGKEKDQILSETDIFVLTSRYEGMPMGVLEAWSYGVPCILTPGTNLVQKRYDMDYYWYSDLDSKCIADTMERAIKQYNKNTLRYRKASFEHSKMYLWSNIAELSLKLYLKY